MSVKNNDFKMLSIRFLDSDEYNYVLSTIKSVANNQLKDGNKINLSDALTKIVKEWDTLG